MNPSKERIIVADSISRSQSIPIRDKFGALDVCTQVQVDDFDVSPPVEVQVLRSESNYRVLLKKYAPLMLFIFLCLVGVTCGLLGLLLLINVFNIEPYYGIHSFFGVLMLIVGAATTAVSMGCICTFYSNNRSNSCNNSSFTVSTPTPVSQSNQTISTFDAIL